MEKRGEACQQRASSRGGPRARTAIVRCRRVRRRLPGRRGCVGHGAGQVESLGNGAPAAARGGASRATSGRAAASARQRAASIADTPARAVPAACAAAGSSARCRAPQRRCKLSWRLMFHSALASPMRAEGRRETPRFATCSCTGWRRIPSRRRPAPARLVHRDGRGERDYARAVHRDPAEEAASPQAGRATAHDRDREERRGSPRQHQGPVCVALSPGRPAGRARQWVHPERPRARTGRSRCPCAAAAARADPGR